MPWRELSIMDQREEFVRLALAAGANRSELCRRFGISRSKSYKWLQRYAAAGRAGLADRSRRPLRNPGRSGAAVEAAVLRIRAGSNDAWGGRKIAKVMERHGCRLIPAPSTITEILRRHGKLERPAGGHPGPFRRFERAEPNELWQMDFKGHFPMTQGRCHPLTVLDDHSRYALGVEACGDEQDTTVRERLARLFRRYGLPFVMLMDNGSPWGDAGDQPFTAFTAWLMRLGIRVTHGRPYHPQTQGKDERFHRTLKAEVLDRNSFRDLTECQRAFDAWRQVYNHERPHEALGLDPPGTRYRLSPRAFPEQLPAVEYGPGDVVRKVDRDGFISFKNQAWRIGKAFRGQPIALRQTREDGVFSAHYCTQPIGKIDLRTQISACGVVDIASAMPTTPQAQPRQHST
ncbi:MAG: IS481 family transposase [Steroidobacteraceae bacterium]